MNRIEPQASVVLENVAIGYSQKHGVKVVASGLNASIMQGELTCLLGANGIGKSTLLRTLSAFQPILDGEIFIQDTKHQESPKGDLSSPLRSTSGRSQDENSQFPKLKSLNPQPSTLNSLKDFSDRRLSRTIGVVLTEKPDIRNMTVREIVGLGRSPYTGFWGTLSEEDYKIVDESLHQAGIEALSSRYVDTLSDGERQKVMIAKALAQQTPIIFLDEPTAFLDFPSKVEVMQQLRRLARTMQKTIFMSTHDLELALQVADRIWLMERERLNVGTPRQLADDGTLSRFVERSGIEFDRQSLSVRVLSE